MIDVFTFIVLALTLVAIIWYSVETRLLRKVTERQLRAGIDRHYNEIGFRPVRTGNVDVIDYGPPPLVCRKFINYGGIAMNVDLVWKGDPRVDLKKELGVITPLGEIAVIYPSTFDVSEHETFHIEYNDAQNRRRRIRMHWKKDENSLDVYPEFDCDVRSLEEEKPVEE